MIPPSITLIESRQPNNPIGTGFVIHHTADHTYILTCAHVVRDMGGKDQVNAATLPAEVIAIGEDNGLDLAVLRVAQLTERPPLRLCAGGNPGQAVQIEGYYKYVSFRALEAITGRLAKSFTLSDTGHTHYEPAWYVTIDDHEKLLGGYSGSPVCDSGTGAVLGVMITSDGEQQGRAISINALTRIWPEMPAGLLIDVSVTKPLPEDSKPADSAHLEDSNKQTEIDHIKELIKTHRRRLQFLELHQARKGINTEPDVLMEIEDLQAKIAENEAQIGIRKALEVEIMAFATTTSSGTAVESLDWRRYYDQVTPAPALWQSTLIPELLAMKQRLKCKKTMTLLLDSDTRLSAALAFGYVFRETTSFQLRVNQYGDIWSTELRETISAPLTNPQTDLLGGAGSDVTIELSSARQHIHPDVDKWLNAHPERIARRIRLAVTAEKINGSDAMAIARAIFQMMHDERRRDNPPPTIHFFAALPKGLAVFIGWHLHTCGPVQFYEKVGDSYQPSCLLDDRW